MYRRTPGPVEKWGREPLGRCVCGGFVSPTPAIRNVVSEILCVSAGVIQLFPLTSNAEQS